MKLRAKFNMSGFDVPSIVTNASDDFKDTVFDSCMRIEANAKINCVVDTGELRSNIRTHFTDDGMLGSVGTDVAHGPFVEFGTGQRGSASGVAIPEGVDYSYGSKAGMAAQPFLFPAFEQERPTFEENLRDVGRRIGH